MSKVDDYRATLRGLAEWEPYLRARSGLPGPRGNLELAHAVAREGRAAQFLQWSALTPDLAPENTPGCFVAFCGALGLGSLLAQGGGNRRELLARLRALAADPRWRVREAVATGLQLWGDADMPGMVVEVSDWAEGSYFEQRAAAAALCEPRLLKVPDAAWATLAILDRLTEGITAAPPADRKSESFRALRQALGYCWSVAVAAAPEAGAPLFREWLNHPDLDVRWIMRENLGKKRIAGLNIRPPDDSSLRERAP